MNEAQYRTKLIRKLSDMFPGCVIIPGDALQQQGILDLFVLWGTRWAALETKVSMSADRQPNQEYFVNMFDEMSFAAFICPENEEEVLSALQQTFESPRRTRVSQS